ncbi:late embryogenesis abundant protein At1g64065-like [Typha angustifolia]|uniref:late embryogenesis abundant protein At1g64065-like n=1 Tax=Typha angustifolia TaxID=59011 RepID=UPI003C2B3DE4
MAEEAKDQARPLSHPSPSIHPTVTSDVESPSTQPLGRHRHRRRRFCLCCCGCFVTTVVLVGLTFLILSLTLFKVKDPTLTTNSITITGFAVELGNDVTNRPFSANVTLLADISIKNPNVASFRFRDSDTDFYFQGETVGVAHVPEGKVGADRTARMNVSVDVLIDRAAAEPNVTESFVFGGDVELTSYTDIFGRVNAFGIYKKDLEVVMNCSITLAVSESAVVTKNTACVSTVK